MGGSLSVPVNKIRISSSFRGTPSSVLAVPSVIYNIQNQRKFCIVDLLGQHILDIRPAQINLLLLGFSDQKIGSSDRKKEKKN